MVSNGSAWQAKALPNSTDTGGNHLNYTTATNAFSCGTSGGGGGTPASPSTSIQFNNAGSFGGDAGFTIDPTVLNIVHAPFMGGYGILSTNLYQSTDVGTVGAADLIG